jgi:hypothetical protein
MSHIPYDTLTTSRRRAFSHARTSVLIHENHHTEVLVSAPQEVALELLPSAHLIIFHVSHVTSVGESTDEYTEIKRQRVRTYRISSSEDLRFCNTEV